MRRLFFLLLFVSRLVPAEPPELSSLQELYLLSSGDGSYRSIIDLEETRWYFLQEFHAPAGEPPPSPFGEHRQDSPFQNVRGYLPATGRTAVGFDSPMLWFGPLTLAGAYAAMESPLEQRPFSAAWEAPSRTNLSSSRSPPSRVGVGGAVGPFFLSHARSESVRRTVSTLSLGHSREGPVRAELLAGRSVVETPAGAESESWTFDEPPLLARTGYHTGARLSLVGRRWRTDLLFSSSVTTLDPPGHAAVARLIASPLGLSLALVSRGYRDGGFDLLRPGVAVALAREQPQRRGHTLGWAFEGVRSGDPGASGESRAEGEARVRWRWRRRSATGGASRLSGEATVSGERSSEDGYQGEAAVDLSAGLERALGERRVMDTRLRGGAALYGARRHLLCSGEVGLGVRGDFGGIELSWESRAAAGGAWQVAHAPGAEFRFYPGAERTMETGVRLSMDEPVPWKRLGRLVPGSEELLLTLYGRYRPRINRAASK